MFDNLLVLFGNGAIHRMSMIVNIVSQIVKTFDAEFQTDKTTKNAAIDTIIDLLQKHKQP